ncbi:MAG: chorismate mutase, partial [bacterium]
MTKPRAADSIESDSAAETEAESELQVHRDRIDRIDEQMLALMSQRIEAARRIGAIKSARDAPAFYRPEREARVLRRLREINQERLDDAALESLFREIMSITRGSEAGLSVAILGPLGTYSESAARQHFGSSIEVAPHAAIDEVFRAAEAGQADFAVAPVENSTEGGVGGTLDRLTTTSLLACGEINLRIHHNLLGVGDSLSAVKRVIAHAQSLAQCKRWLDRNLPGVELVATASNADAARSARDDPTAAAIAGDRAAERYRL